ncbi:MAG: alginate O-acetyltransferase complex protein AlgI, partial [Flavobacteriales bacterium]
RSNIEIVAKNRWLPMPKEALQILLTFSLTVLAWIFFRADTVGHALLYLMGIFNSSLLSMPVNLPKLVVLFIALFIGVEWMGREGKFALEKFSLNWPVYMRWPFYFMLLVMIFYCSDVEQEFIYFQF